MSDNSLIFDLKNGELTMQLKKKIVLKANSDTATVEDGNGMAVSSSQGKFTAECNNIELTGNAGVKIESKASLEAKGATFNLEGSGTGNVKAGILNLN